MRKARPLPAVAVTPLLPIAVLCGIAACGSEGQRASSATDGASSHYDELADLPFPNGYPTAEAADALLDELAFQRAVQTYLWSLPAMNVYAMREGQRATFGAESNVLAIWKDRIDYNTLVTTANPDVIYAFAWLDLKAEGPTVLDMPPGLQGLLDDMWHRPLTDIGAAGPDGGSGGKYVVLPPDFQGQPPAGHYVVRSPTYGVFVFLRAFLTIPSRATIDTCIS